jgi:hypothetical protein
MKVINALTSRVAHWQLRMQPLDPNASRLAGCQFGSFEKLPMGADRGSGIQPPASLGLWNLDRQQRSSSASHASTYKATATIDVQLAELSYAPAPKTIARDGPIFREGCVVPTRTFYDLAGKSLNHCVHRLPFDFIYLTCVLPCLSSLRRKHKNTT